MKTRSLLFVLTFVSLLLLPSPADSLTILLTNQEGWDAPGIQKMKKALIAADHEVLLVAPSSDQSGSGTSLTPGPVSVTQESENEYAVDATPATCVAIGFSLLGEAPDLVVSGTATGRPGPAALFSGTVGAAITAVNSHTAAAGVPAIAFSLSSTAPFHSIGVTRRTAPPTFEYVSDFAVGLISYLESGLPRLGDELLPPRVALHVHYPRLLPEFIRGITIAAQGHNADRLLSYQEQGPGIFVDSQQEQTILQIPGTDNTALRDRFITIVPIVADLTADADVADDLAFALRDLTPTGEAAPIELDCNGDGLINGLDILNIGCDE